MVSFAPDGGLMRGTSTVEAAPIIVPGRASSSSEAGTTSVTMIVMLS